MYASKVFLLALLTPVATFVGAVPIAHKRAAACAKRAAVADAEVLSTKQLNAVAAQASATAAASKSASTGTSKDTSDEDNNNSSSGSGSGSGSSVSGALKSLFPIGTSKGFTFTTSPESKDALPLSDSTLTPTKDIKELSHDYVNAPDGKKAMKAHYPKGSMNPGSSPRGGFSFYGHGPEDMDLSNAKEVTFGYSVFFEKGFAWTLGGKLPGLYGGNSEEDAVGCSGGSRSTKCFSARLMWREDGQGEFYTYLPPFDDSRFSANKKQCDAVPNSDCNPEFGNSIGRGAFDFKDGAWTTVSERVKLNDVGKANGEMELFVNGKSVISIDGVILRDSDAGRFRGMMFQTFFGGSKDQFRAQKDSNTYFSDISLAVTQTF